MNIKRLTYIHGDYKLHVAISHHCTVQLKHKMSIHRPETTTRKLLNKKFSDYIKTISTPSPIYTYTRYHTTYKCLDT